MTLRSTTVHPDAALHQPTASDLRFITTGLKITHRLEESATSRQHLRADPGTQTTSATKALHRSPRMAEIAQSMVKDSIDAFMRDDTDLADQVIERDDEVDLLNYQVYRETAQLHGRRRSHYSVGDAAAVRLQVPRTDRRSRTEHRRDGDLYGQGKMIRHAVNKKQKPA